MARQADGRTRLRFLPVRPRQPADEARLALAGRTRVRRLREAFPQADGACPAKAAAGTENRAMVRLAMTPVPECLECGACCFSRLETYVRLDGADHARLGSRASELVHFEGNRAYLRMVDGHCAALVIDSERGRFVCAAYPDRPRTCRDLERGSEACLGEIASKHERPQLALAAAWEGGRRPG